MIDNDKDINEVFDDILLAEEKIIAKSYENGFTIGSSQGNIEGYHLGYHRGAELGAELGFYAGIVVVHLQSLESKTESSHAKINSLKDLKAHIDNFPTTNVDSIDILELMDVIRSKYKKVFAQLKIGIRYPESDRYTF